MDQLKLLRVKQRGEKSCCLPEVILVETAEDCNGNLSAAIPRSAKVGILINTEGSCFLQPIPGFVYGCQVA
jgi:hypothetical protein